MLTTPVFGLGGPDGPAEFLDLFQHRLLSLLYRILRKHRIAAGYSVPSASPVQAQLRALTGLLPQPLQERQALPDAALLARSALFA
ncbi:hypothetical protein A234_18855, partial [Pseudomonas syringae pv. actinidiae ICMP 19101]